MRSTWSLLCLGAMGALLLLCSDVAPRQTVNCRMFVFHPLCRGVAAKRSDLPAATRSHLHQEDDRKQAFHPLCRGVQVKRGFPLGPHQLHNTSPRKQDEDGPEPEYVPVPVNLDLTGETPPRRALWSYLAERPTNVLLAHRKLEPETIELYDYE